MRSMTMSCKFVFKMYFTSLNESILLINMWPSKEIESIANLKSNKIWFWTESLSKEWQIEKLFNCTFIINMNTYRDATIIRMVAIELNS